MILQVNVSDEWDVKSGLSVLRIEMQGDSSKDMVSLRRQLEILISQYVRGETKSD